MNTPRENEMNIPQELHERLCAYVFGELEGADRTAFEAQLAALPELLAEKVRLEATIGLVKQAMPAAALSSDARSELFASARRSRFRVLRGRGLATLAAASVALVGGVFALRYLDGEEANEPFRAQLGDRLASAPELDSKQMEEVKNLGYGAAARPAVTRESASSEVADRIAGNERSKSEYSAFETSEVSPAAIDLYGFHGGTPSATAQADQGGMAGDDRQLGAYGGGIPPSLPREEAVLREALSKGEVFRGPGDTVPPGGGGNAPATVSDGPADSGPASPALSSARQASGSEVKLGLVAKKERGLEALRGLGYVGSQDEVSAQLENLGYTGEESESDAGQIKDMLRAIGYVDADDEVASKERKTGTDGWFLGSGEKRQQGRRAVALTPEQITQRAGLLCGLSQLQPGESPRDMFFRYWGDNPFQLSIDDARSTFAVDVDTASYTLTRAYLTRGQLPPREAVRSEEFVNYFRADQPAPMDGTPFAIGLELAPTPFNPDNRTELLRITVRAKDVAEFERQLLALTFVIDVSGSMNGERIGFVKQALTTLLSQLYAGDSVAIVAFSNEAREVSPMVSAGNRGPLESAIAGLVTNGGTNVEAGLRQGYALAATALTRNAVNRVILCSDGVGNIGETKGDALLALVAEHQARGIYLNTVGVGMGNHNDAFLEQLADKGDGLCQYVDSAAEAQKVFGQDLAKALQPVARDVKIQVEFDPAQVEAWRQIGYENRALRHEDFRNDTIDAGEVNSGHQVSALYEVVRSASSGGPLATVRLRYKPPFPVDRGDTSRLGQVEAEAAREIERAISFADSRPGFAAGSIGFRRSALAAQLAEVLRRSQHARNDSLAALGEQAQSLASQSEDPEVRELAELIAKARPLLEKQAQLATPRLEQLLDGLARLHFERGQRERKRIEVEDETLRREEETIRRLEVEVRQALGQQLGVELPGSRELRRELKSLGYGGDDR